jgi:hypothetical protein
MQPGMHRVPYDADAERPVRHSHAERGNDQSGVVNGMATSRASLAPTRFVSSAMSATPVGARLAREGGLSGDDDQAPGTKCFCAVPRAIRREM